MDARAKFWVETEGEIVLSDWRIGLLKAIDASGSLTRAAEDLRVPYRTAWQKLKQMEQRLGVPLVLSHSGGTEGGGTRLTPAARELVTRYDEFTHGLQKEVHERFAALLAPTLNSDHS